MDPLFHKSDYKLSDAKGQFCIDKISLFTFGTDAFDKIISHSFYKSFALNESSDFSALVESGKTWTLILKKIKTKRR